jgi:hypothetical protein
MLGLFQVETVVHRHAAEYHISFCVAAEDVDRMVPYLRGVCLSLVRKRGFEPRPDCSD